MPMRPSAAERSASDTPCPARRSELTRARDPSPALELFADNPFKVAIISSKLPDDASTTVYRNGPFVDLCRGPHLPSTHRVQAFAVTKNSGSLWLGKAGNDPLQRVYGITFPKKEALKEWKALQAEAAKRDHRAIGVAQARESAACISAFHRPPLAATLASHRLSPRPPPRRTTPPHPSLLHPSTHPHPCCWPSGALLFRRSLSRLVLLPSARLPAIQPADGSHSGAVLASRLLGGRDPKHVCRDQLEKEAHNARVSIAPPCPPQVQPAPVAHVGARGEVQGEHVLHRHRGPGVWSQANELPGASFGGERRLAPHHQLHPSRSPAIGTLLDVQAPEALVPRAAVASCRLRRPPPQRAIGRAHWADTRPSLPAGWRAANDSPTRLPVLLPTPPAPP